MLLLAAFALVPACTPAEPTSSEHAVALRNPHFAVEVPAGWDRSTDPEAGSFQFEGSGSCSVGGKAHGWSDGYFQTLTRARYATLMTQERTRRCVYGATPSVCTEITGRYLGVWPSTVRIVSAGPLHAPEGFTLVEFCPGSGEPTDRAGLDLIEQTFTSTPPPPAAAADDA